MASKVFLDANILLDLTLKRPEYQSASNVMKLGIQGTIQLHTTPAVLHILAYFVSQAYNPKKAKQLILTLLNDVQIIECDHSTALSALSSGIDDIEDALLYFTAIKFEMDCFISSDQQLKKKSLPQLPVYSAREFLKRSGQFKG